MSIDYDRNETLIGERKKKFDSGPDTTLCITLTDFLCFYLQWAPNIWCDLEFNPRVSAIAFISPTTLCHRMITFWMGAFWEEIQRYRWYSCNSYVSSKYVFMTERVRGTYFKILHLYSVFSYWQSKLTLDFFTEDVLLINCSWVKMGRAAEEERL